jgi:hypothetical protein
MSEASPIATIRMYEPGARGASHRHAGAVLHGLCDAAGLYRHYGGRGLCRSGWANPVIALAIACFKAVVVILFFMHVKYQSRLIKMTVGAGFFTFLVLITMTLSD